MPTRVGMRKSPPPRDRSLPVTNQWVVFLRKAFGSSTHAVCSAADWNEMEAIRPGYHTLVCRVTGIEGEAEDCIRALQTQPSAVTAVPENGAVPGTGAVLPTANPEVEASWAPAEVALQIRDRVSVLGNVVELIRLAEGRDGPYAKQLQLATRQLAALTRLADCLDAPPGGEGMLRAGRFGGPGFPGPLCVSHMTGRVYPPCRE